MNPSLFAPFTIIDLAYREAFEQYLETFVGNVQAVLAGPLLACVTLWIIVQGVLVMRGDLDPRRGITKMITVAVIIGLVSSSSLYDDFIMDFFKTAIPELVADLGGNFGLPQSTDFGTPVDVKLIPLQLDVIYRAGQIGFHEVAAEIPPDNELDALAFQGAQFVFVFSLWTIFSIYHLVDIMTTVLLTIGPLFLLGFLFDATKGMTMRWVGQLATYAILLLLLTIVASVVVGLITLYMTAVFAVTIAAGTTAGAIAGLYELDLFIMSGAGLIVALPTIAAFIAGGVGSEAGQLGQSVYRGFGQGRVSQTTMNNMAFMR